MMCQPNCVCTGGEIWFVFSAKATLSNGATVWPFVIVELAAVRLRRAVSVEYFFASVAKSAPAFSCASIWSASALVFTRMWRTCALAGCL